MILENLNNKTMIYSEQLLFELQWEAKLRHAEIVMRKCIRKGKYKTAMKIALKYGLQIEESNDDTVMAFAMASKIQNYAK